MNMNAGANIRALLIPSVLGLGLVFAACDQGDTPVDETMSAGDDDGPASSGSETGSGGGPTETVVAIDESFDGWDGGGSRFFMSKPENDTTYEDNNTLAMIDGREAIAIHANAEDNDGNGYSIEFQLQLDQQTDMSGEDFRVSFDVYIPEATGELQPSIQWAFYETAAYTPIYSVWYSSLPVGAWTTIEGLVSTSGDVDYSAFAEDQNPSAWTFDVVRIQCIITAETAGVGDEILFYVDNLKVTNEPA